jgi:hypothetical protein
MNVNSGYYATPLLAGVVSRYSKESEMTTATKDRASRRIQ